MSFSIDGWVEIKTGPENPNAKWLPLLSLYFISIPVSNFSRHVFGLPESGAKPGLFSDRGVPSDASRPILDDVEANKEHLKKFGVGSFGHTYFSLKELKKVLIDSNCPHDEDGEWKHIFNTLEFLFERYSYMIEECRFVIWAS